VELDPERRKAAVRVWVEELRRSKLSIVGTELVHPPERREEHLKWKPCRAVHVEGGEERPRGCRCYCAKNGCGNKRSTKCWWDDDKKVVVQHDVC